MRIQLPFAPLFASLAKSLCLAAMAFSMAASAHAASGRTFVSGTGSDGNTVANCARATPCRSFAMALTVTSPGGAIEALDAAGYGPITISGSLSIEGVPGAAISVPSGGNGITINAGASDFVTVSGLLIDGGGVGNQGIQFNSGSTLIVTNCVVQNFTGYPHIGINIHPTSGTVTSTVTNTTVSNNFIGIIFAPASGSASIDHVVATGGQDGIDIAGSANVAISNSISSNNTGYGIATTPNSAVTVSVDNTTLNGNSNGIVANQPARVLLSRSVIQGNGTGISNSTNNTFYTYGNNLIDLNGAGGDINGPLNTQTALR